MFMATLLPLLAHMTWRFENTLSMQFKYLCTARHLMLITTLYTYLSEAYKLFGICRYIACIIKVCCYAHINVKHFHRKTPLVLCVVTQIFIIRAERYIENQRDYYMSVGRG